VKALHGGDGDYAALTAEHKQMTDAVAAYEKQLPAKQAAWEKTQQGVPAWSVLEAVKTSSNKGGATLTRQADGSLLATGPNITPEAYQVTTTTKVSGITAIRLEVLTDPSLPRQGPGRASNGNFVLNEFRVTAAPADNPSKEVPVKLTRALADYSQPGWAVEGAIDGNPESGWAVDPAEGQAHVAVFELKEPLSLPGGARLTFQLDQHFPGKEHNIGRFRLSVTTVKPPLSLNKLPEPVAKALNVPAEKRTAEQKVALAQYYRSIDPELARLNQNVADHPAPPADPRQVGAQDLVWALLNSPAFQFNH